MARICLGCGQLTKTGNRCPSCKELHTQRHNAARQALHTPAYQKARRAFITAHVIVHGYTCPGDEYHPEHPVKPRDLTIDHHTPRSTGVDPLDQDNWRVTCRSANSRKGAHHG